MSLLSVRDLRTYFDTDDGVVKAVDGVSFDVFPGQVVGIVGESGCGKSTLARCLVRLYEPDGGSLSFEGKDVLALSGDARRAFNRQVQMVFQVDLVV
jgi:ABC-type oligopeptide transport system ATPase subunit